MKAKNITIQYTTGEVRSFDNPDIGFLLLKDKPFVATQDWSMDDVYKSTADFLLSTMETRVGDYGSYKPLLDALKSVISQIEKQLAPDQWSKEYAASFCKAFLFEEVMSETKLPVEKRQYKALHDKMEKYVKKATANLSKSKNPTED